MRLMKSTTSPFARLAHAMLIEAGAEVEVELLNPWADPERLVALNPARRVPALRLDDGTVLTEGMAIATYARTVAPEGSHLHADLTPAQLEIVGHAFGAMEAAVYVMAGRMITSGSLADLAFDAHPIAERRRQAMRALLGRLDGMADRLREDALDLPEVLVVDAVQYMDFRFPGADWRPEIPALDAWIGRVSSRPSVAETVPS